MRRRGNLEDARTPLAKFDTAAARAGRISNGGTEAINLLIEKARHLAHGFRTFRQRGTTRTRSQVNPGASHGVRVIHVFTDAPEPSKIIDAYAVVRRAAVAHAQGVPERRPPGSGRSHPR